MLTALTWASLADVGIGTISVYLSPGLFLGCFFTNLAISGSIIWRHSPFHAKSPGPRNYERVWNILAATAIGAATLFAVLPAVS